MRGLLVPIRLRAPLVRSGVVAGLILLVAMNAPAGERRERGPVTPTVSSEATVGPTKSANSPARFVARVEPIGPEILPRMGTSWKPGCPVPLEDLRLIRMTFWDFEGVVREGELLVHERHTDDVAGVFRLLFQERFPIALMELANGYMGNDPPLAQFNNTVGFNCRPPVGGGHRWSEHSYGSAVDINPDQNPYVSRGGRVEPPFGAPWVDRSLRRPGMIFPEGVAVRAFRSIGWRWGGDWSGSKDYMHFSASGR